MPLDPPRASAFGPQFYRVPAYSQASALLLQKLMKTLVSANCCLLIKSFFFVFPRSQETENNILDAEPLVGKGVGAALFLASKKGIKLIMF